MSETWASFLEKANLAQRDAGLHRARGGTVADREELVDFGSNDYLGLRNSIQVVETLRGARGLGSGASPVLSGHTEAHRLLESRLAHLCGFEDALVFSSGFACNVGTLACLARTGDLILSDELNHASLIDGCRLSRARVHVFPHNAVRHCERFLHDHRHEYERALLCTEAVFSMDGDLAPLSELAALCQKFDCGLVVDEAHATGVYGARGSGLVEELGLEKFVLAKLGTLSKAIGSMGGYVCGSVTLIEFLVNHCRSYLFSTSPPAAVMAATATALEILEGMNERRVELRARSIQLRARLREMGWQVPEGDSPVIPVIVGSRSKAQIVSEHLRALGMVVPAIRPPTVPAEQCRLRISLSTQHTTAEIEQLISGFAHWRTD